MNIEHISCVQLDFTAYFHLMPSLVKYSFPCDAINQRLLIKMFLHNDEFFPKISQLVIPIWTLSMHIVSLLFRSRLVVCTFCAPFQICTSQENKHWENITRTISWNPPISCSHAKLREYKKNCFKKRKVYVKPSTPIVTFCNGHPEISLHPSSLWECVWVTGFRGSL